MKKYLLLLVVAFPLIAATTLHKYYVSITELSYNEEHKSIEIISRIFYDDIEQVLQERYDSKIQVDGSKYPKEKLNEYLEQYFKHRLHVFVNGEEKAFNYLGYETDLDYLVFYLEIENIEKPKSIAVENPMLMEVFSEQKNVVHVKVGDTHKSFMLYSENDKAMLNFDQ